MDLPDDSMGLESSDCILDANSQCVPTTTGWADDNVVSSTVVYQEPWTQELSEVSQETTKVSQDSGVSAPTPVDGAFPQPSHNGAQPSNAAASTTTQIQDSTISPTATKSLPSPGLASSVGTVDAASSNNGSGLSSGAVAGIAIATLIIGAALAFLAAFFLFKRRNKEREANVNSTGYTSYADSSPELALMRQKTIGSLGGRHSPYVQVSQTPILAPIPAPIPAPAPVQKTASEDSAAFLPPAADDGDIHAKVTALFGQIHRHVETYYRDVHASITPSMEPDLARFGAKDVDMAELLQDCSSPTTALKHALVAYVLRITAPKQGNDGDTIFPEQLTSMHIENHPNTDSGMSNSPFFIIYCFLVPHPRTHN
jgi:hypothetical protein